MTEKHVRIHNKAGIHCRPSSLIMGMVDKFPGNTFRLESTHGTSNLTSILDLLSLGLQCGEELTLKVSGPQEKDACEKITQLLETEFDFR